MLAVYAALISLFLSPVAHSAPTTSLDASVFLQNGKDAQALNAVFANLSASDSCNDGEMACVSNSLAHCVNATWQLEACSKSLSCFALPSVREQGIDISCTTNATALAIINASGATGGIATNSTDGSVALPMDCDGDDESDPVDNSAGSESSSVSDPASTSASESSTRTHKSSHSTSVSAVASSATASATDVSNSTSSVITVTVTVAPTSTAPTETFTLDPSQASSFLSSIATESGVSITTILPSSASAASVTSSVASSAEASSATVISSKQVGVASSPSGSLPAISAGPIKTITLLGQAASTSSAQASATVATTAGSDLGYSY